MKFLKVAVVVFVAMCAGNVFAEGRIAVLDLEAAVLNTDLAKSRLNALRAQSEYKSNVQELESLKKDFDKQVEQFQKDMDVLSNEQKMARKNKIDAKRADAEHIARKLEAANKQEVQSIMQEIGPSLQQILPAIIKDENIGLLLPRQSVMHVEPSYDITAKVADKLNRAK